MGSTCWAAHSSSVWLCGSGSAAKDVTGGNMRMSAGKHLPAGAVRAHPAGASSNSSSMSILPLLPI